MQINIEIMYSVHDSSCMRRASFPVNVRKFRQDPEKEATRIAIIWLRNIKKEHGSFDLSVIKLTYDQIDITDKVRDVQENGWR
jgi:hypothetical protein